MPDGARASLFIHALTGLHPGSGTALGVVDLPVQRERHTNWPLIPASSIKGVLRAAMKRKHNDDGQLWAVFGPDTDNAAEHAGALALTDARILAFPVRSLKGVFAWITCPTVLARFCRDRALVGEQPLPAVPTVTTGKVRCPKVGPEQESPLLIDNTALILEEFDFDYEGDPGLWPEVLAQTVDAATGDRMRTHLAILSDDDFGHFVQHATEVVARIGLDAKTKTVKNGALFYEEVLPAETLFHALVMAESSRRAEVPMPAAEVLAWVRQSELDVVQIGADETIGRGICRLTWADGGAR
ncbi:type III-B CRISPR module RAMP protein Cmr4 [Rhodospirillum centenum]|uniref:CRISPR-associated RAMP protein, putative n=1 Tax=Rhodospirillum centenum (strain ATCC 51521 / SW) TaxID=414684 RepID=B6IX18_RHOCS|nr:type III-B CRISPR module RAMP protein Cmr4 [Rhodospirillum centenum]ACJ00842.1 CRISPR-associated RAMP protein, putative [Rhodospirillum centenum SW]